MNKLPTVSEIQNIQYECECFRKNSKKKWTPYYLVYSNATIYFFEKKTLPAKKSFSLTSQFVFELETSIEYAFVIKIESPKGLKYYLGFNETDDAKKMLEF